MQLSHFNLGGKRCKNRRKVTKIKWKENEKKKKNQYKCLSDIKKGGEKQFSI